MLRGMLLYCIPLVRSGNNNNEISIWPSKTVIGLGVIQNMKQTTTWLKTVTLRTTLSEGSHSPRGSEGRHDNGIREEGWIRRLMWLHTWSWVFNVCLHKIINCIIFIGEMLFNVNICEVQYPHVMWLVNWIAKCSLLCRLDIVIITKAIQNLFTYVQSWEIQETRTRVLEVMDMSVESMKSKSPDS